MTLATMFARSKASNAELAAETGLHPTLICRYRKGRVQPGTANAVKLQAALARRGVETTLAEVLGVKLRKRAA